MHDPVAPPLQEERARFTGEDAEFRRLVTKGALLELATAGFYRFWLATRIRQHLWGATILGGDPLEYLGTGRELLYGFLFALAILAPIYIAYLLLGLAAESYKAFASLPLVLFFIAFGQFALYRARRYRLHRTAWRGLRFGMGGSGWAYSWRAMLWGAAVIATLGLALPWAAAALERYKMRNTLYGDLQGSFVGRGWDFFKRGSWIWLVGVVGVVLWIVLLGGVANSGEGHGAKPHAGAAALGGLSMLVLGLVAVFFYGAYKAIQWRWWVEGVRIGNVGATSDLRTWALIGNYWKFIGWAVLTLLLGVALLAGVSFALAHFGVVNFDALGSKSGPHPAFIATIIGWYLLLLLAMGVLWRIYFVQRVWKLVILSLTLHGLDAAREVKARETTADAIGEGLMDSFDIAGF
ncbi:DUF898 family protein [Methylocystis bryophila]|uniref:DUF898 domain-containing protein n=1 Tax=Methylocystis bryophila TaxID=655015 RepID=A0A1W6MV99_9HYPH|nr:DUF898 family protein [Methylocystis bryophila]ARN81512.1 hypothetical protein B1812_11000 [Methylocystis bryophila]BDV37532.1 membrane protein [Methylocystis bryophila]